MFSEGEDLLEPQESEIFTEEDRFINESPTQIPTFTLTDLPNEITLHILSHVPDSDLLTLSFLSRTLHTLALPLYLARKNFGPRPENQLVLYDYNALDALEALEASFLRVPLRRLYYPVACAKDARKLTKDFRMLTDLLDRKLEILEEAQVDFWNPTPATEAEFLTGAVLSTSAVSGDRPSESDIGLPEEVHRDFLALLDAVLARGCRSLRISHSGALMPAVMKIGNDVRRDLGGGFGPALLRDVYWQLRTQIFLPLSRLLPTCTRHKNSLHTFNLHSPLAFQSSIFSSWTLRTLNSSAITTLSISQQFGLDEGFWSVVLPCIDIPTLTSLYLGPSSMRFSDLLTFLARHDRIRKLLLGGSLRPSLDENMQRFSISLPCLEHLSAPSHLLNHLIGPTSRVSAPVLSSVTISLFIEHNQHYQSSMLNDPLFYTFSRLKALQEVHLSLSFASLPTSWELPQRSRITNCLSSTSLSSTGSWNTLFSSHQEQVHDLITHMDLELKVYSLPLFPLATKLQGLVTRFPKLRHLRITSLSKDEERVDGLRKDMAVRVLLGHCPQLDSVEFGCPER